MLLLIKNFFGGAACGAMLVLAITFFKNMATFKKEDKVPVNQILMWVIIGFLIGGSLAAACF